MEPLTLGQLHARVVAAHRLHRHWLTDDVVLADDRWLGWRLDAHAYTLDLVRDGVDLYQVDLERCTTSARVLDWIAQVRGKAWADVGALAGLVRALDDVIDLQATLCSFGEDSPRTPAVLRSLVDSLAADPYQENVW